MGFGLQGGLRFGMTVGWEPQPSLHGFPPVHPHTWGHECGTPATSDEKGEAQTEGTPNPAPEERREGPSENTPWFKHRRARRRRDTLPFPPLRRSQRLPAAPPAAPRPHRRPWQWRPPRPTREPFRRPPLPWVGRGSRARDAVTAVRAGPRRPLPAGGAAPEWAPPVPRLARRCTKWRPRRGRGLWGSRGPAGGGFAPGEIRQGSGGSVRGTVTTENGRHVQKR